MENGVPACNTMRRLDHVASRAFTHHRSEWREVDPKQETLPSVNKAARCDVPAWTIHHLTNVSELNNLTIGPEQLLWLDLERPSAAEPAQLAERFHLHPLAIEDAEHGHQRPKIEEYEGFVFLVFYAIELEPKERELQSTEIRMFAGEAYLFTIHDMPLAALDKPSGSGRALHGRWSGALLTELLSARHT